MIFKQYCYVNVCSSFGQRRLHESEFVLRTSKYSMWCTAMLKLVLKHECSCVFLLLACSNEVWWASAKRSFPDVLLNLLLSPSPCSTGVRNPRPAGTPATFPLFAIHLDINLVCQGCLKACCAFRLFLSIHPICQSELHEVAHSLRSLLLQLYTKDFYLKDPLKRLAVTSSIKQTDLL